MVKFSHSRFKTILLTAFMEWSLVVVYPKITRLVCRVAGRSFVGTPLNRNKDWIKTSCIYTRDTFMAAVKLREWNPTFRNVVKYFIPEYNQMQRHNRDAERHLIPLIQEREKAEKRGDLIYTNTAIDWVRDAMPKGDKKDYHFQAVSALAYNAASIHTTSQLVLNSLYDLAARPEYIEILREEEKHVLNESGGEWSLDDMAKLKKMDSFMKEVQHHQGAPVAAFQRKVIQIITLSDGTYLKAGTWLLAPTVAISHDSEIYENLEDFDRLRYYKLRERSDLDEKKNQFASTSKNMMHFGAGRHACPGRWVASHEIKLILATFVLNYDIKVREDVGRPKNILFQWKYILDPTKEILFKSLKA
ncbi:cytochrome P450 [Halenospora varia]|nr:cytochrome P450 [Halenospora varia]